MASSPKMAREFTSPRTKIPNSTGLTYLNLATKEHAYLTSGIPWDVEEFDLSKDGKRIAFLVNEDGMGTIHILDTATRKITNPKHPAGVIGGLRWHRDNKEFGFTLTDARVTGDAFSLNADTGQVTRWTQSESAVPTDCVSLQRSLSSGKVSTAK